MNLLESFGCGVIANGTFSASRTPNVEQLPAFLFFNRLTCILKGNYIFKVD